MLGFLILHISIFPRIPQSVRCRFLICGSFGGRTIGAWRCSTQTPGPTSPSGPSPHLGLPATPWDPVKGWLPSGVTAGGGVVGGLYYAYTGTLTVPNIMYTVYHTIDIL